MQYYRMNPRYKKTSSGQTMTVILDLNNSDPTTWATYADDAVGMTAGSDAWDDFFGHYPCILENGVELGKLKRDNFGQYEDGTSAPITTIGKDVMICFPRRGIKLEYLDENTLSVSMTNGENVNGFSYKAHSYTDVQVDKFYLGVYKGYVSSNKLYSSSGKTLSSYGKTFSQVRQYATARGTGYFLSAYYQLTYRLVMYLLKYKGQNHVSAIGYGNINKGGALSTGGTNTRGMDWGNTSNKKVQMKLFGLEDFYGNLFEFIDGYYISDYSSGKKILVADGDYGSYSKSRYVDSGAIGDDYNYLRYPQGNNIAGFVIKHASQAGAVGCYFNGYQTTYEDRWLKYGSCFSSGNDEHGGLFNFDPWDGSYTFDSTICARLMYIPYQ